MLLEGQLWQRLGDSERICWVFLGVNPFGVYITPFKILVEQHFVASNVLSLVLASHTHGHPNGALVVDLELGWKGSVEAEFLQ